jgi:hypothetical protein
MSEKINNQTAAVVLQPHMLYSPGTPRIAVLTSFPWTDRSEQTGTDPVQPRNLLTSGDMLHASLLTQ